MEPKIKRLPISEVAPGMVTARDIYSRTDQLILNRDSVLGADSIAKLMFYSIGGIWVYEETLKKVEEDAYTDTLRKSADFIQFKQKYDATVQIIQNGFEQMVMGKGGIEEAMMATIEDTIKDARSNVHIFNMLHCIREYDDMIFMHSINVALICNVFANWLRLGEEEKKLLTTCGLFHDAGKLLIPTRILNKPGKLSEEEYAIAKMHPESGYELLKNLQVDERVLQVVKMHHERYDGSGYPEGKSGDEIDMYSCLVGIADVYDAMTSKRIYRGALCPFDVIKIFEEEGMNQFNPQYLLPLMGKLAETYIHHTVRLSDDSRGEVIMINPFALARPVVKVGNSFVDLTKRNDLKIVAVL